MAGGTAYREWERGGRAGGETEYGQRKRWGDKAAEKGVVASNTFNCTSPEIT